MHSASNLYKLTNDKQQKHTII